MSAAPVRRSKPAVDVGTLAETLVAQWLMAQGWEILQHRWRCRWGELDLVACSKADSPQSCEAGAHGSRTLAFVEVKARSRGNWDDNGLLAITAQKQAKLWQAADLFLAEHSHLAVLPCRFDVALVSYRLAEPTVGAANPPSLLLQWPTRVEVGQPVAIAGHRFTLRHYLEAAFDQS